MLGRGAVCGGVRLLRRYSTASTSQLHPKVIPFHLDSRSARDAFDKHQGRNLLGPSGLLDKTATVKEVLLPFYIFDCTVTAHITGEVPLNGKVDGGSGGFTTVQVYGGYVYPRHLGQVAAPGAMAADNKQMTQQEIAGAELQQHSMSEAVAWRLAERALHAEELATAPERLQASHVAGATARNVRVHLEINQRTCTTTHAPAFVLTYGFGVKLVEEGDHAGKRMTEMFMATVSGTTGAVAAESHLSSERAQWLVAGVMGMGMATEMVVAPGSNFLFGVPGLFATGILSLTAGQAVMSFEHNTREATWNKMMQEEGERQESWLAAWAEHGVGVWVDSEMLRQREDSEWRRWETKEKDQWQEEAQERAAEELMMQQDRRRTEAEVWLKEQENFRRKIAEEEARQEAKRAKYGASWGQAAHGQPRGMGAPRDFLGYFAALGLEEQVESAGCEDIKAAFRRVAMKLHPDRQRKQSEKAREKATAKFLLVQVAYETLRCPEKRARYLDRGRY